MVALELHCDEAQALIPWLLDDELDAVQTLQVEDHLGLCGICRGHLEKEGELRVVVREASATVSAPPQLRHTVRGLCDGASQYSTRPPISRHFWPLAAAVIVVFALVTRSDTVDPGSVADVVWDEFTRSHALDLPMDVAAGDFSSVQTYLGSHLPFAVHAPASTARRADLSGSQVGLSSWPGRGNDWGNGRADLRADGRNAWRLVGGRVMRVDNRDAAYLRYVVGDGRVSFFVQADNGSRRSPYRGQAVLVQRRHGYTVARWHRDGLVYSAVSELPERQLRSGLRFR